MPPATPFFPAGKTRVRFNGDWASGPFAGSKIDAVTVRAKSNVMNETMEIDNESTAASPEHGGKREDKPEKRTSRACLTCRKRKSQCQL